MPLAEAFEIVVERESEWSDEDRNRLLGLMQYEREVGPCGYHPVVATDEKNQFMPHEEWCPVCAGLDRYRRIQAEQDKVEDERGEPTGARKADGRVTWMRLLSPAERVAVIRD